MMIRYQEMSELARENSRTKKRDGFRIAECVPFSIGLECRQGFRGYGQDGDLQATLRSRWNIGIAAQAIKFLTTRARSEPVSVKL